MFIKAENGYIYYKPYTVVIGVLCNQLSYLKGPPNDITLKILQEQITGWWLTYPSEKYEFVSWDYSQYMEK